MATPWRLLRIVSAVTICALMLAIPGQHLAGADDATDVGPAHVRPKPSPRNYEPPPPRPPATPEASPTPTAPPGPPRLDDLVLRWLPEIIAASEASGIPSELIAAIMRIESHGNPNIISPAGARGLMQIMPVELEGQGIPIDLWHDPATNIMAGGYEMLERLTAYGSLDGAVSAYFGFGCDVFGTCTETYVSVVFGWAAHYAPIIADPLAAGFAILGPDWVPPAINPFVEEAPPTPEPPPTPDPDNPTPVPTAPASPTPNQPSPSPTTPPTEIPTEPPTEEPTEIPTEIPTEPPTEVPTEEPTEPPTEEPVEPAPPPEPPPEDG